MAVINTSENQNLGLHFNVCNMAKTVIFCDIHLVCFFKVIIDVMIQILLEKVKRLAIKSDNVLL